MDYVLVRQRNFDGFENVLPSHLLDNPGNICICACDDEGAVGAICYSFESYQIDVLWLYTVPEKRRQGIATSLLDKIFEIASASGAIYPISAQFEPLSDESLYNFFISYEKLDTGFSHDRYYISPKEIRGVKLPESAHKQEFEFTDFFSLQENVRSNIFSRLNEEYGFVIADPEAFEESADKELCRCILRGDEILDLIFLTKRPDGNLELDFLLSNNPKGLLQLLEDTALCVEEKYPKAKLVFDAISDESSSMAKKLFPLAEPVPVYEAQW